MIVILNHFYLYRYKEEMNYSRLQEASLLVFGGPREKFTTSEVYKEEIREGDTWGLMIVY